MKASEFQKNLREVLFGTRGHGLSAYCCVRDGEALQLRRLNVKDDLREKIDTLVIDAIKRQYISEDAAYDTVDNIANNDSLYLVEANESYNPFGFLFANGLVEESYSENDKDALVGFAFCFSIDSKIVWAYQHAYPVSISKKTKGLLAVLGEESVFERLDSQKLLGIECRVDAVIIEGIICPIRIKLLEQHFGFEAYVRKDAQSVLKTISMTGLLNGIEKLNSCISEGKLTNAKKLLKIKNSPVLLMPAELVVQRLAKLPRYSNIKIQDGKIMVTSEKDVSNILKMFCDDLLRSELSQKEYDSHKKTMLSD